MSFCIQGFGGLTACGLATVFAVPESAVLTHNNVIQRQPINFFILRFIILKCYYPKFMNNRAIKKLRFLMTAQPITGRHAKHFFKTCGHMRMTGKTIVQGQVNPIILSMW